MTDRLPPDAMTIPTTLEGARRLPVYFLLDTSQGMTGAPLEAMCRGLEQFRSEIQSDAFAIETIWVGVITFGGRAAFVTNGLVPISQFVVQPLVAGGENVLGEALELLTQSLDRDIRLPTRGGSKGDWRAHVFILLASEPTDDRPKSREELLQKESAKICRVVTVSCGPHLDQQTLKDIAVGSTYIADNDDASFKALFAWISAAVSDDERVIAAHDDAVASTIAVPDIIDLGCLEPGISPRATIRIEGGPATATTDNKRIVVTPSEIGEQPTEVEITVMGGLDGELIWDTLHIKGDRGELEIPVICMWGEALARSFRESARTRDRRNVKQPVEREEQVDATKRYDVESRNETEPAAYAASAGTPTTVIGARTYVAQSCPYCGKNSRYDSDNKTWMKCEACAGVRKLISVPRRATAVTRLGIKYATQDLKEIWDVLTGKQDWTVR